MSRLAPINTDLQVLVGFEHATKINQKPCKFIKNTDLQILVDFSHTATTIGSKLKEYNIMFYILWPEM